MKTPRQNNHLDAVNGTLQGCFIDILIYPWLNNRNTYIRKLLDVLSFEFEENVSKLLHLLRNIVGCSDTDSERKLSTRIGKYLNRMFQTTVVTYGLLPRWRVVPIFVDIFCRDHGCAPNKSQRYFSPSLNIILTYI